MKNGNPRKWLTLLFSHQIKWAIIPPKISKSMYCILSKFVYSLKSMYIVCYPPYLNSLFSRASPTGFLHHKYLYNMYTLYTAAHPIYGLHTNVAEPGRLRLVWWFPFQAPAPAGFKFSRLGDQFFSGSHSATSNKRWGHLSLPI